MARLTRGAIAAIALCLGAATVQAEIPVVESEQMTVATLDHILAHRGYLPNPDHMNLYLSVQGKDPSVRLLEALRKNRKFKAESTSKCRHEGCDDIHFSIGRYSLTGPTSATADVSARCGLECGEQGTISLQKLNGKWRVTNFNIGMVE